MTLRVKLEVVPFGDEDQAYEIGRLDIFNKGYVDGAAFSDVCEYGVIELTPTSGWLHNYTVKHSRRHGAWFLVQRVLNQLHIGVPTQEGKKK